MYNWLTKPASSTLESDDRNVSIHAAISHYEKHMQQRAADMTLITLESTRLLHSGNGIERMLAIMHAAEPDQS